MSIRVEVTRADHAADIALGWVSGIRYDMGATTFHQDKFDPGLLEKLVYWEEGSYFHQGKLDRLRESLSAWTIFPASTSRPTPTRRRRPRADRREPGTGQAATLYTAGLAYGTESGPGIRLGLDRRYVNSRGHKLSTFLDYAQKRKTLVTQYRIPAFKWLDGWCTVGVQASDEQTDYIDLRHVEFTGSRSGQVSEDWTAVASIHALRERWRYVEDDPLTGLPDTTVEYATFTYPSLRADYTNSPVGSNRPDQLAGSILLRGGVDGAGSDANFLQFHMRARWSQRYKTNSALIVRGEYGHTFTSSLVAMPPSLRFFAGATAASAVMRGARSARAAATTRWVRRTC